MNALLRVDTRQYLAIPGAVPSKSALAWYREALRSNDLRRQYLAVPRQSEHYSQVRAHARRCSDFNRENLGTARYQAVIQCALACHRFPDVGSSRVYQTTWDAATSENLKATRANVGEMHHQRRVPLWQMQWFLLGIIGEYSPRGAVGLSGTVCCARADFWKRGLDQDLRRGPDVRPAMVRMISLLHGTQRQNP